MMNSMQRLFEHSKDLMCIATLDGYFTMVNPAFSDALGYSSDELTSVPFLDLVHPADRDATVAQMAILNKGQAVSRFENRYRCKDGSFKWLAWAATPELAEKLIYAIARDVTDSKQSLEDLLGDLPGMVYRCINDADWTMSYVSSGCHALTGYTREQLVDVKTISYNEIVHPLDRESLYAEIQAAVDAQHEYQMEYRINTADGREKVVWEKGRAIFDDDGKLDTLQGYIFDITDRRKLRDEVVQLQRMESLGQLTGGVAHDFNNLLTIMIGNLQLLEVRISSDAESRTMVGDALESAWRGAELCKRLLAFGRRQMLMPEPTNVNALIVKMEKLIQHSVNDSIKVDLILDDALPDVIVDQGQLENAILNLTVNARDAMPDGGGLVVRTYPFEVTPEYAALHADVIVGNYVAVEVTDTGIGMSPDIQERAIEPFFTTKEHGKGTGLGLSMVYGLLKQSGGHFRIYSETGYGTSIKLYLPVLPARDIDTMLSDTTRFKVSDLVPRGTERILVVEDDVGVRRMVVKFLGELGYAVCEANSAEEALQRLNSSGEKIDLLFTDVVMAGGVDGVELSNLAVAGTPTLKVLLTSGFSRQHLKGRGDFALLSKPYHNNQLAAAVRQVLES
jgi:PAS domain S-box-containing protein